MGKCKCLECDLREKRGCRYEECLDIIQDDGVEIARLKEALEAKDKVISDIRACTPPTHDVYEDNVKSHYNYLLRIRDIAEAALDAKGENITMSEACRIADKTMEYAENRRREYREDEKDGEG